MRVSHVSSGWCYWCRPTWTPHLDSVVGYSEEEVLPCLAHLWKHYNETFPSPDGVTEL